MLAENDMAGLLSAQAVSVLGHILVHILISHRGLLVGDACVVKGFVQAEVGHDGGDYGVVVKRAVLLHVFPAEVKDQIAVHLVAVLVHGDAAVRVAVVGKAHVAALLLHILLQHMDMGGAAVSVDVQPVGSVVDHMGLGA